jgi:hypothetical protein
MTVIHLQSFERTVQHTHTEAAEFGFVFQQILEKKKGELILSHMDKSYPGRF